MATTARQQYFADESSLSKDKREFSISVNIQNKIDSVEPWAEVNAIETVKVNWTALVPDASKAVNIDVPDVVDNLYSTSTDDALSAKQWKVLYDYIQNISFRWRFLSNWNCATGLPTTNPSTSPYQYLAWDYYTVSNISTWWTNYRPEWSSYTIWIASTTVETSAVNVSDMYLYDGSVWVLMSGRQIAIDTSLSTMSINPVENRVITNALNSKAEVSDVLTKTNTTSYTPSADYNPATKKYVDDNINTKTFFLTWTTWQTNLDSATSAYQYWEDGKDPIIMYNNNVYTLMESAWPYMYFRNSIWEVVKWESYSTLQWEIIRFTILDDAVVQIWINSNYAIWYVIEPNKSYTTPFNPQDNWDPATKKYVDDKIQYVTQDEYTALLPWAASDGKHYFIYTEQISPTPWWQPWANTLLYLPLNSTYTNTDQSGKQVSTTNYNVTFWTYQWVDCWTFGNDTRIAVTPFNIPNNVTFACRCYNTWVYQYEWNIFDARVQGWAQYRNAFWISSEYYWYYLAITWNCVDTTWDFYKQNQWVLFVSTCENWEQKIYLKGNNVDYYYSDTLSFSWLTPDQISIGQEWNNAHQRHFVWWLSNLILEDKIWTAQEISDYYDQTKADYGIS